jgi:hypothetical protein
MAKIAVRSSGLVLLAGALFMGAAIVFAALPAQTGAATPLVRINLFASSILLILALPGIYARQSEATGWLGLLGHVLLEAGMVPVLVYAAAPTLYPQINTPFEGGPSIIALLLGTAWLVGFGLTGIATLRAGVYPRWPGILLLAAGAGLLFVFSIGEGLPPIVGQVGTAICGIALVAAFAWIGLYLWLDPRGYNLEGGAEEGVRSTSPAPRA